MLMARDAQQDSNAASSSSSAPPVIDLTAAAPSTPTRPQHKYKADPTPRTKFYVPPQMSAGTSSPRPPLAAVPNGSGMPSSYPGAPSTPKAVRPAVGSLVITDNNEPSDGEEELRDLPDFAFAANQTPEEREAALQKMVEQAVHLDDNYDPEDAVVDGLSVKLMPHQIQGYHWMRKREAGESKGGILADDMGLGKTVQALALIVGNRPKNEDSTINYVIEDVKKTKKKKKPAIAKTDEGVQGDEEPEPKKTPLELKSNTTLIIAPLAVVAQWEREANEKTNCGLKVLVHHGPNRTQSTATLKKYDVVITTFPTASSEYSQISKNEGDRSASPLFRARWLRVILDEAHNIKNHKTVAAAACFELSDRAHSRWCLTGTPIQNNPYEMFSLIHFLAMEPFNDYPTFKEKIGEPLKSNNQHRVNWGMKRLCIVLQTIMLRRAKDAKIDGKPLLNLPQRNVQVITSPFDNDQEAQFYKEWQETAQKNSEKEQSHIGQLVLLLRLRQATSHPALVAKDVGQDTVAAPAVAPAAPEADDDIDALTSLLSGASIATKKCKRCQGILAKDEIADMEELSGMCRQCTKAIAQEAARGINWVQLGSTKTRIMLNILKDIQSAGNEKTIVFSQFTSYLDLAQQAIEEAGIKYVRYDGSMRPRDREESLRRIREEPKIKTILISFKAGSTGLNLTCCSRVLLMDLWWNPALEAQAFDRAHRVGQVRDVEIYKICIENTVEARILELQEKKLELSKAALEGSKLKKGGNSLSKKELWYLFHGDEGAQVALDRKIANGR